MPRQRSTVTNSAPLPEPTPVFVPAADLDHGSSALRGGFFRRNIVLLVSSVALVAFAAAGFFYWQAASLKADPQKLAQQEAIDLVERVGKLIVLPTDEAPTIATVADPEKLKDQIFFTNAKTGSKVLIYTKARKAILYDPESDRLLEVAPMSLGESPE